MEGQIAEGKIGAVGKYDVEFKGGSLVLEIAAEAGPGSVGLKVEVSSAQVIDAIEKAIPGQLDDMVLELLKAALGK